MEKVRMSVNRRYNTSFYALSNSYASEQFIMQREALLAAKEAEKGKEAAEMGKQAVETKYR